MIVVHEHVFYSSPRLIHYRTGYGSRCSIVISGGIPFQPTSLPQHPLDTVYSRFTFQLTFPDSNDSPASPPERRVDSSIALSVRFNFILPVSNVALRCLIATRAAVPEASVDEQSYPLPRPAEIRCARKRIVPSPTLEAVLPKKGYHFLFRTAVTARPDGSHVSRAGSLVHCVGHRSSPCVSRLVYSLRWPSRQSISE